MSVAPPSLVPAGAEPSQSWVVQELEGRGRGVVSTAEIPSGSVVLLESRPLVAVVHSARSLQACAHCFALRHGEVSTKFLPHTIVCTQCNQAAWCSEECRNQSTVLSTHPAQICAAYKRLAQRAAETNTNGEEDATGAFDAESQSDARLLFYAYYFRRYRPEEFARWSLLCSIDTKPITSPTAGIASSSSVAPSPPSAAVSAEEAEEEERIERLHDIVVDCLQYAAQSIAEPAATAAVDAAVAPANGGDVAADAILDILALAPPPALFQPSSNGTSDIVPPPSLAKQFTDLHISHPSDDLTSSLALDADLAVTRSLYLKAKCNGFALMAPNDKLGNRQTPRGYAIYTSAAMVNHSCMPNLARFDKIDQRDIKFTKKGAAAALITTAPSAAAASSSSSSVSPPVPQPSPSPSECSSSWEFTPLALELRAMHTIPAYTELCIAYVPLFWERRDRQAYMREEYGFKCRCDRCRLEKVQEREERQQVAEHGHDDEEEHSHSHEHDDDDDGEEEGDDEDEVEEDAEEPISDDDAEDLAAAAASDSHLTRGELNIWSMKYTCPSVTCGGTMAPVKSPNDAAVGAAAGSKGKPTGEVMECNICAKTRTDAQFHRQLQKEFGLRK